MAQPVIPSHAMAQVRPGTTGNLRLRAEVLTRQNYPLASPIESSGRLWPWRFATES